jgi:hypothetical protein
VDDKEMAEPNLISLPEKYVWDLSLKEGEETSTLLSRAWPRYLTD